MTAENNVTQIFISPHMGLQQHQNICFKALYSNH